MDRFHRFVRVDPSRLFASIRAKRSVVREDSNDDLFSVEYHRDIPMFPKNRKENRCLTIDFDFLLESVVIHVEYEVECL